jgi:phosphoglucomutase
MNGAAEIAAMMEAYRNDPPAMLNGVKVIQLLDYEQQVGKQLEDGRTCKIDLPKSNVLQFILEDGSKISARPSGTEPKIKFYFSVNAKLNSASEFDATEKLLDEKIAAIEIEMGLK